MGLLDKIKDVFKEPTKDDLIEYELYIHSASHYQENLDKLVKKIMPINNRFIMETFNEQNMVVWKYNPCYVKHIKFEKDPKNEYDKNAIKILGGSTLIDMALIGYIPMENNVIFSNWMDANKIFNTNLVITGGEKKIIAKNNVMNDFPNYSVVLKVLIKK